MRKCNVAKRGCLDHPWSQRTEKEASQDSKEENKKENNRGT